MSFDGEKFGTGIADIVRGYVEAQLKPIHQRLDEIEKSGVRFRGIYQRAQSYRTGEMVTMKGSLWTAITSVPEGSVPGESPAHWQLSVKGTR